jgi:hypothetical protein
MHMLSSPIHYIKLRKAYNKQKRTALHMLTVSGVVRPSHVELHYSTPTVRKHGTLTERQQTHPLPLPSWDHDITRHMTETGQWARGLSSSLVQFAKKPIVFRWTKQLDL